MAPDHDPVTFVLARPHDPATVSTSCSAKERDEAQGVRLAEWSRMYTHTRCCCEGEALGEAATSEQPRHLSAPTFAFEYVMLESALSAACKSGMSYKQCMLEINGGRVVPRLARCRIRARPLQTSGRTHGMDWQLLCCSAGSADGYSLHACVLRAVGDSGFHSNFIRTHRKPRRALHIYAALSLADKITS